MLNLSMLHSWQGMGVQRYIASYCDNMVPKLQPDMFPDALGPQAKCCNGRAYHGNGHCTSPANQLLAACCEL